MSRDITRAEILKSEIDLMQLIENEEQRVPLVRERLRKLKRYGAPQELISMEERLLSLPTVMAGEHRLGLYRALMASTGSTTITLEKLADLPRLAKDQGEIAEIENIIRSAMAQVASESLPLEDISAEDVVRIHNKVMRHTGEIIRELLGK